MLIRILLHHAQILIHNITVARSFENTVRLAPPSEFDSLFPVGVHSIFAAYVLSVAGVDAPVAVFAEVAYAVVDVELLEKPSFFDKLAAVGFPVLDVLLFLPDSFSLIINLLFCHESFMLSRSLFRLFMSNKINTDI